MNDFSHDLDERNAGNRFRGTHARVLADLKALLDGELAPARVWLLHVHLWFCPSCREEVTWLKRLGEDMRDLERAVPSPRLRARILAALPETPPGRPAVRHNPSRRWAQLAAASALALVGVVAYAAASLVAHLPRHARHTVDVIAATLPANGPLPATTDVPAQTPVAVEPLPAKLLNPVPDEYNRYADDKVKEWLQQQENIERRQVASNRSGFARLVGAVQGAKSSGYPRSRCGWSWPCRTWM